MPASCVSGAEQIILCHFSLLIPFPLPLRLQFCLGNMMNDNAMGRQFYFWTIHNITVHQQSLSWVVFCLGAYWHKFSQYICISFSSEVAFHLDGTSSYTDVSWRWRKHPKEEKIDIFQFIFLKWHTGFRSWRSRGLANMNYYFFNSLVKYFATHYFTTHYFDNCIIWTWFKYLILFFIALI